MDSKVLLYINGHFYDKLTRKRIELRDRAEICVVGDGGDFQIAPTAGRYPLLVLDCEQQKMLLQNDPEVLKFRKIFERGSFLYFSLRRKNDDKSVAHHVFKVELLENLYVYLKKNWKQKDGDLFDCACVVRENISKSLDFFEEINAKSLNEAYKYTFVHYFGNKGNPACNALDRFYEFPADEKSVISKYRGL